MRTIKMRNEYQVFAGKTEEGSFIFLKVNLGDEYFSMSSDEISPQFYSENDKITEYENFVDDMDADTKLEILERFDARPSEAADVLERYEEFSDHIDCSLTPSHLYHLNGEPFGDDELYLVSGGCGQFDSF